MQAGKLRTPLEYQTATTSQDATGQPIQTWATVVTVMAAIDYTGGSEAERAMAVVAERLIKITIRYRSDVTPLGRFKYGTRLFYIKAVADQNERHREVVCECTEKVA